MRGAVHLRRALFTPIPVVVPPGLAGDEKLLAAWSHVSTDQLRVMIARCDERSYDARALRRRVLALREARS